MRLYLLVPIITLAATVSFLAAQGAAVAHPAQMESPSAGARMDMADSGPAHFKPTRKAYTSNHDFLVKLIKLPQPIPYQKYFTISFEVFNGRHPSRLLKKANLSLFAGMRHGLKHGFAHGMDSSPKIINHNGTFTVEGMYFHMMGRWTLKVTITNAGKTGIAYFDLPCCAQ